MLNETFPRFTDRNCKYIDIGDADFDFVAELGEEASTLFVIETVFGKKAKEVLGNYLLEYVNTEFLSMSIRNGSTTVVSC